jgi:hypothetical protein
MIKTANGKEIEYQTLEQKLEKAVNSQALTVNPVKINCSQLEKNLLIIIEHQEEKNPDTEAIIAIINQVIAQAQIIDEVLIHLADSAENLDSRTHHQLINNNDNGLKFDYLNKNDSTSLITNTSKNRSKKYRSKNFSVGLISFILGLIVIGISGLVYYFSRPCVVGKCLLIPETETKLDNILQSITADTQPDQLRKIQATISEYSQELTRIPSWSDYYHSAQDLRQKYQAKNKNIAQILTALKLEANAENMSQNLPLSHEEWLRVKTFWQDAISLLQANQDDNFSSLVKAKLIIYQNEINIVDSKIETEKQGDNLLTEAQQLATIAEQKQQTEEINSLTDLQAIEQDWIASISQLEHIPEHSTAYQKKEELLNKYLTNLSAIQEKIKLEKNAKKLLNEVEKLINLAKESQQENQWTKAINNWEQARKLLENYPQNSSLTDDFEQLKEETQTEIVKAKAQLKLAVTRENIRSDLQKICTGTGPICSYSVTNDLIKVYLTNKYLENVAKISMISNSAEQKLLENHINQVEKNYQFISSKYQKPLQVYNPQKKLILEYP